MGISVIIPVADGDSAWRSLLPDLTALGEDDEVVLVSKRSLRQELQEQAEKCFLRCACHWAPSAEGRAKQLNTGTRWSTKNFYWFLHCDSRLTPGVVGELKRAIAKAPDALHFFNLKFLKDGPWVTFTNGYGVWFRARVLRLPFGDQGYCLHRDTFRHLGGFSEKASYGEDHLLIWRAHQNRVKLSCVIAPLFTSARRYRSQGWIRTTSRHVVLTVRQAAPELGRFLLGISS